MLKPMSGEPTDSLEDFWSFYVREHLHPLNRACHYAGTTMVIGTVATAAFTLNPAWLLLAPVVGYGPAWVGHFVFEKNKPASFSHPLYSLRGDWVMWGKIATGTMDAEVERYTREAVEAEEPHASNGASAVPVDATVN